MRFRNVAFYRFVTVENPAVERRNIRAALGALPIKGTIILATEGINANLAGTFETVETALAYFLAHPIFSGFEIKESESDFLPFAKLSLKVKKEMGHLQ